jgi:hypothetical protein
MSARTPKWTALLLTLFAALSLIAFVACGGDDDDDATTAPTGTSQSNVGGDDGDATPTDAPDNGDDGGDDNGDGGDDLLSQLEQYGGEIDQITGTFIYTNPDDSGDATTITYYNDPPRARWDQDTTSFITNGSETYVCDSSDETCIQYDAATGEAFIGAFGLLFSSTYVNALVAGARAAGIDVETSSETIAGIDANCFSGESEGESYKFCFSDEGLLLLEEFGGGEGGFRLEATSVSSDVSDADFEPPYPVMTLPALPGQ